MILLVVAREAKGSLGWQPKKHYHVFIPYDSFGK